MKVFNFSAGPAMLPKEVMERAKNEFCAYGKSGCGIMELTHSHTHRDTQPHTNTHTHSHNHTATAAHTHTHITHACR